MSQWLPIQWIALLTLLLIVAACAESSQPDGPDPAPGGQSGQSTATPTPTQKPTPTATPTPSPTPTPIPTATPEPTPTPSPKPAATPEPTVPPSTSPDVASCTVGEPVYDVELEHVIRSTLGDQTGNFGVVVQDLTTGARAEVNPNRTFYAASLYKVGVMYEVYRQIDAGTLTLDQAMTVTEEYAEYDLGTLEALGWEQGGQITIREALNASITLSDNVTAYMLADTAGWWNLNNTMTRLGLSSTNFSSTDLPTTAHDMTRLLDAIACAEGVSDRSGEAMLDLLTRQAINDRLPRDLPQETVVAHKTGNWENASHDVGIVYGPQRTYIVSVLSNDPGGANTIARLSYVIYDYVH